MDFSKFCNICYNNSNLNDASSEEEGFFKELIISIVGNEDLIRKSKIFICGVCCYKLEGYDKFRQMILTNMIQMRQAYYQLKNRMIILKSPDIDKTLQEFLLSRVKYRNVDVFGVCQQVCDLTSENGSEDVCVVESDDFNGNNSSPDDETSDEKLHSEIDLGISVESEEDFIAGNENVVVVNTANNTGFDVDPEENVVDLLSENGDAGAEGETTFTVDTNEMEIDYNKNSDNGNENISEDNPTVKNEGECSTENNICLLCDKVLSSRYSLLRHKQIHKKNLFQCNECGKSFNSKYNFVRHQNTHEKENDTTFDGTMHKIVNEIPKHVNIAKEKELFQCLECENTYSCKSSLSKHQKVHIRQRLYTAKLVKSNANKCIICKKNNITAGNTFCKKCGDTFGQPMKCSKCSKTFQLRSELILHEQDHFGNKLFSCKICNKTFFKIWCLKYHDRIHTGVNPFVCALCRVSLSSFQILRKHEVRHIETQKTNKKSARK